MFEHIALAIFGLAHAPSAQFQRTPDGRCLNCRCGDWCQRAGVCALKFGASQAANNAMANGSPKGEIIDLPPDAVREIKDAPALPGPEQSNPQEQSCTKSK